MSPAVPASVVAAPAPLADLWGLEPLAAASPAVTAADLRAARLERGGLRLGDGPTLVTRLGEAVRLPAPTAEQLARLEALAALVLTETYRDGGDQAKSPLLRTYYLVRPLLPRAVQIRMRQIWARGRERRAVLAWPADSTFVSLAEAYLALRLLHGPADATVARLWPAGSRAAATLTHDVEGPRGQERCWKLAELEMRHGVRSCFNFVAERYPVDRALMRRLQDAGFEIGLHGIKHDGKKFRSRALFESRLRAMPRYRDEWGVVGFRSPATHRRWDWMTELPFTYDSSYPDTDPYEPMAGGCGSPWPFAIGPLVEVPITQPQDHTLWEILRRPALPVWESKLSWLQRCGGLATTIVHPDYLETESRWREYEAYLERLRLAEDTWIALPRDVAAWWRRRAGERRPVRIETKGEQCSLVFG